MGVYVCWDVYLSFVLELSQAGGTNVIFQLVFTHIFKKQKQDFHLWREGWDNDGNRSENRERKTSNESVSKRNEKLVKLISLRIVDESRTGDSLDFFS